MKSHLMAHFTIILLKRGLFLIQRLAPDKPFVSAESSYKKTFPRIKYESKLKCVDILLACKCLHCAYLHHFWSIANLFCLKMTENHLKSYFDNHSSQA